MRILRQILYLCGMVTVFSVPCLAQNSSADNEVKQSWEHSKLKVAFTGNAIKKDVRGVFYDGEAIYTTETEKAGNVAFYCLRGGFGANVSLAPADFGEIIDEWMTSKRRRGRKPTLIIDGEKQKSEKWIHLPALKLLIPQKKRTSAQLYNAAVKGREVQIKVVGKDTITLILPKPNTVFADFGAGCNMGRKK